MKKLLFLLIVLLYGTTVYATPIKGDANGDGLITSADATFLARYLAGHFDDIPNHITHTSEWLSAMDINCDGHVSAASITRFAQRLVGTVDTFCPRNGCEKCYTHQFPNGNGTAESPYEVSTPIDLNAVRYDLFAHYIQTNDIDMTFDTQHPDGLFYNGGAGWQPIGNSGYDIDWYDGTFQGVYDDNGFTIMGLSVNTLSQKTFGELSVGDTVYLKENGTPVPFIVVQQGRPSGLLANGNFNRPLRPTGNTFANNNTPITAYANWNNVTILMRENVINPMRMGNDQNLRNVFRHSEVYRWLNNTYFNTLDEDVRNSAINVTIPVIDCGTFHTLSTHGNQTQGIGAIAERVFISNLNARVWIPHAAEVGIPWGTDNASHTNAGHAFPNALSVLHWMPGAGTTWQQWNNTIRFSYFPFGHGTNPNRTAANTASEKRIAYCDNGIARTWWTRCPGNQISGFAPAGVAVSENGVGSLRRIRDTAWVRPTIGFSNATFIPN